jgi:hypothetical protein
MEYIGIEEIMSRLTGHPMLEDIALDSVIGHTRDFIRALGAPNSFIEKTTVLNIEDFRASLPCDFYEMIQVRSFYNGYYRYSTDSFHMSKHPNKGALTYKIQGSCIFSSIPKDKIEIAYTAFPVSDEGLPLIPDNSNYLRALEAYIKMKHFGIKYDMGRLPQQVYLQAQRDYALYAAQAQSDMVRPTIDQMEAFSNMWNKYLPESINDHQHGYVHQGTREHYKTY